MIDTKNYLLIFHQNMFTLIEDKCGHFGISLQEGKIEDGTIICPQHQISFNLKNGEVVNRPWESCDLLTIHPLIIKENTIYFDKNLNLT
jgi:nitrite reductase/ring-hydroxylating ferredoxin subunit